MLTSTRKFSPLLPEQHSAFPWKFAVIATGIAILLAYSITRSDHSNEPANSRNSHVASAEGWATKFRRLVHLDDDSSLLMYGSTRVCGEGVVSKSLRWLANQQFDDGSWQLHGLPDNETVISLSQSRAGDAGSVAATSLVLRCFFDAGFRQDRGRYWRQITAATNYLIVHQAADGGLGQCEDGNVDLAAHALATYALCESYSLSEDIWLGFAAQRAIDYLQRAQDRATGGWQDGSGQMHDLVTFGWIVDALTFGWCANFSVDPATFRRSRHYLDSFENTADPEAGLFVARPGETPTLAMMSCLR